MVGLDHSGKQRALAICTQIRINVCNNLRTGRPSMRVAVVCGGGVAGLSSAISLARTGWSVDVYERGSAIREIGAGIFIKGNGLRVLESYGLLERLARDCVFLEEAHVLDADGKLLQRRILKEVNRVWNIKRQNLVQALRDRATELAVEIGLDSPVDE